MDYLARLCLEWDSSTVDVETYGVRRAIVRTGMVLSANGGALPRLLMPFRIFVGGTLGSGRQRISWIHVEDETRAIVYLLDNDTARGSFNLVAPKPVTNREFA
jgi:NAD dependent epimerase/dehydratase family enzyme